MRKMGFFKFEVITNFCTGRLRAALDLKEQEGIGL